MTSKHSSISNYDKAVSWEIFDAIYKRYDTINTILSVGILRSWRQTLVKLFPIGNNMSVLDCATGTGEVMASIMKTHHHCIDTCIGLDLSKNMMALGKKRFQRYEFQSNVQFVHASATKIPYNDKSFNCVTMAFGIRNIIDFKTCLAEIYRVLSPEGTVMIMEFSLPKRTIVRWLYLAYFRGILPIIGGFLSGDKKAYSYLNKTVESFPYGEAFKHELEQVGFKTTMKQLTFGIATLYIGKK